MALFSLQCCIESLLQASNEATNCPQSTEATVVAAKKKKGRWHWTLFFFFCHDFVLYKEKDGSKVDANVGRAFLRKRSRRSSAIFGSFFWPCCCVEIDAKSRSTIELIAISVILTELAKETQQDFVPFGGQTIQAPL